MLFNIKKTSMFIVSGLIRQRLNVK